MKIALILVLSLGSSIAGPFTIGPDYRPPTNDLPASLKSAEALADLGQWKVAEPGQLDGGAWWEMFGDPLLSDLQRRAGEQNQSLRAAFARVNQARAAARLVRGDFFPRLDSNSSVTKQRTSATTIVPFPANGLAIEGENYNVGVDLSYEVDLWGRVRRSFEAARADAAAATANLAAVILTLRSDLAANYFALRALDAEQGVIGRSVEVRRENLGLMQKRLEAGASSELDVARAATELASAETELAAVRQQRFELENAIAILVGENPSNFRVEPASTATFTQVIPSIPDNLPSELLERRPDIAEAERRIAAANARIGVAKAAAFPVLRLTGNGGMVSGEIDSLFNWDSRAWSIGPSLSIPIFAGGKNRSNKERARAAHEEALANYRQEVLVAFAEVENALSGIRNLAERTAAQDRAVQNARRAAELARTRFEGGLVSYFEVMDAERTALQVERGISTLRGQQQAAVVRLVRALGGGFRRTPAS